MQKASKDIQLFIFIFYEYNSSGISNINALGLYDSMRTVIPLCFLINVSCLFNATVHGSVAKWSPLKPKTRRLWAKTPASPSCQRVWESHPSPAGSLAPCSMQYVCVCVCVLLAWCKVHLKSAYDLVSTLPGDIHTHAVMPGAGCDSRGASLPRLTLRVLEEVNAGRTVSSVSAVPQVMEAVGWCVFQSVWIHRTCDTRTPVISNRPSPYTLTEVFQCWRFLHSIWQIKGKFTMQFI